MKALACGLAGFIWMSSALFAAIDRQALVTRHNPRLQQIDYDAPLTVGNGGFAFTVDVTGLQTFEAAYYRRGIPLETLSRWCWVADENPKGYQLADTNQNFTLADGRVQPFPTNSGTPAGDWLRRNPRDQPLGQLALEWQKADGSPFVPDDVKDVDQRLDLWRGVIASRFTLGGVPVEVITACDSKTDSVAVRIVSDLVQNGTLRVRLGFPRGHDPAVKNTPALDWSHAEAHQSNLMLPGMIKRTIGQTNYFVISDRVFEASAEPHVFRIRPQGQSGELAFTLKFSPQETERAMRFDAVVQSSEEHWRSF